MRFRNHADCKMLGGNFALILKAYEFERMLHRTDRG